MLKASHIVLSILGALSLSLATTAAEARRVPGWAGIPDPPSSGGCWSISAGRLSLNTANCGDNQIHFFQLPVIMDSANGGVTNSTWFQGHDGLGVGTVCARPATINQDGTVAGALGAFQCGDGAKAQSFTVPFTGSAMLTVYIQSNSQGMSAAYFSNLNYTP